MARGEPKFPKGWPKDGWRSANSSLWVFWDGDVDFDIWWGGVPRTWTCYYRGEDGRAVTKTFRDEAQLTAEFVAWKLTHQKRSES